PQYFLCCSLMFDVCTAAPTTSISTLSLHDALPILHALLQTEFTLERADESPLSGILVEITPTRRLDAPDATYDAYSLLFTVTGRSEEHTSELQSRENLVCRLLLEKNNTS